MPTDKRTAETFRPGKQVAMSSMKTVANTVRRKATDNITHPTTGGKRMI